MKYLLNNTAATGPGQAVNLAYQGNQNALIQVDGSAAAAFSVRIEGRLRSDLPFGTTGVTLTQSDDAIVNIAVPREIRAVIESTDGPLTVAVQE